MSQLSFNLNTLDFLSIQTGSGRSKVWGPYVFLEVGQPEGWIVGVVDVQNLKIDLVSICLGIS